MAFLCLPFVKVLVAIYNYSDHNIFAVSGGRHQKPCCCSLVLRHHVNFTVTTIGYVATTQNLINTTYKQLTQIATAVVVLKKYLSSVQSISLFIYNVQHTCINTCKCIFLSTSMHVLCKYDIKFHYTNLYALHYTCIWLPQGAQVYVEQQNPWCGIYPPKVILHW